MFCFFECSCSGVTMFVIFLCALLKLYNDVTKGVYKGKERLEGKTAIVTGGSSGVYKGKERLEGKTAIVTGGSSGIGAETAKDLARRGARVVILCRDMAKGESVRQDIIAYCGNNNIVLKHIDFSSLASVRKCAAEILAEESRIDILVNNAGGGGMGLNNITPDGMEIVMQTNHFGPFLFTNLLLGKMKESPSARIVNVSSVLHKYSKLDLDDLLQKNVTKEWVLYANSKLANIYFTTVLAEKLKSTGITVNVLHPGAVKTEITRNSPSLWQYFWILTMTLFFKNAKEGAQTTIFLCVSPSVAKVTGKYFSDCKEVGASSEAQDYTRAKKLWELSEKAVKLASHEKHF